MFLEQFHEIIALLFMSLALGMDAFSVSLGIGMGFIRLKRIAIIGFIIGLLHVIFPFIGIVIGNLISNQIGHITTVIGGSILIILGAYMFFSAFQSEVKLIRNPKGLHLLSLSLLVSIDSFPVGLGLGMSGMKTFFALIMFGFSSMILTWIGMLLGRKASTYLGVYSELFGGSILFTFGLHIIFNL